MKISKDEISLWEYPLGLREHLLKIEGDEIEINDILHTIERVDWLFWLLIKLGVSKENIWVMAERASYWIDTLDQKDLCRYLLDIAWIPSETKKCSCGGFTIFNEREDYTSCNRCGLRE
jgi:hypothetical protein